MGGVVILWFTIHSWNFEGLAESVIFGKAQAAVALDERALFEHRSVRLIPARSGKKAGGLAKEIVSKIIERGDWRGIKNNVKSALAVVISAVALLLMAVAMASTNSVPNIMPAVIDISPANGTFLQPAPLNLEQARVSSQLPRPGVYKTEPYAIILVVPERGMDDRILSGASDVHSQMPVINPGLKAVPRTK